jgi:branched-subunit amino acid ABC-type transport system permease component
VSELFPFLVVGCVTGSLYGLAGMGLVLTFRTSGIFNFAHGAVASVAAYIFFDAAHKWGLSWPVAFVLTVVVIGVVLGLAFELLARCLESASTERKILGTVGALLAMQGLLTWIYGPTTQPFPKFLPQGGPIVSGVRVTYGQIITVVLTLLAAAGMWALLNRTRVGAATRAVVDDSPLVALAGISPARVRRLSWLIGASFAALTGVLIGPSLGRDPYLLTLLVVQAFGAAAVGAFRNLWLTYAGGVAIGVATAVLTKYTATSTSVVIGGLPTVVPFAALLAALLIVPVKRFPAQAVAAVRPGADVAAAVPRVVARSGGLVLALALVVAPLVAGPKRPVFISAAVLAVVFLSLSLLVRTSGQVSLCQAVFVGFGATTFAHLTSSGVPWLVALPLAGLAVVPLGALVAIPAIRLSGIYLALATFGFGIVVQRVLFPSALAFGDQGYQAAPRPPGATSDTAFYYVVLAVAGVCALLGLVLTRGRPGRLLQSMGEAPVALTAHGLSVPLLKLVVFCLASFVAGVAGALMVSSTGQVGPDVFGPFTSLTWVAVLAICGSSPLVAPVLAAALFEVLPAYTPSSYADAQTFLFGALALVAAVAPDLRIRRVGTKTRYRTTRSIVGARTEGTVIAPPPAPVPLASAVSG